MINYSQSILFQLSTRAPTSSTTVIMTAFSTTTTRTPDYTGRNTFLKFWFLIWNVISSEIASLHNSIDKINVILTKLYQWLFWKFNTILPWFQMKSTFLPNILTFKLSKKKKLSFTAWIDSCNHHHNQDMEQKYIFNKKEKVFYKQT